MTRTPLYIIMETSDPDDCLAACWLLGDERVTVRGIAVHPGTLVQVGVVRQLLDRFGRTDVLVGASGRDRTASAVTPWHERFLGHVEPSEPDAPAEEVLAQAFDGQSMLFTGAPLTALGAALDLVDRPGSSVATLTHWVAQGGFAGEGVVSAEQQLSKFRGQRTCPTFNFDGNPSAARRALDHPAILRRSLVSKNVCHAARYDEALHERLVDARVRHRGLAALWDGMAVYLARRPGGKALHDVLAAVCVVDPSVVEWANAQMFRERDGWGAALDAASTTRISVGWSRARWTRALSGDA